MVSGETLQPVLTALQNSVTTTQIINFFATGVAVAIPIILVWYSCKWIYARFIRAVKGGRG